MLFERSTNLKDLLLTVCIGQPELGELTVPRMQKYASKHGMDFHCLTESQMFKRLTFAYWEAFFQLVDSNYDRLAVLDSDILIHDEAPNILNVPFYNIALKPSGMISPDFHERIRQEIAADFLVEDMFNAGVIVITRAYLEKIAQPLREMSMYVESTRYADQVYLCLAVKRSGEKPTKLSWRWNQHDGVPDFRANAAHFLHFRGPRKEQRIRDYLVRNRNMSA